MNRGPDTMQPHMNHRVSQGEAETQTSANVSAKGHYLAEMSSFDLHWTVHVSRCTTRGCTRAREFDSSRNMSQNYGTSRNLPPNHLFICWDFLYLADLLKTPSSVRTHSSTMRAASPVSTSRIWWTAASRLSSATHSRRVGARRLPSSALPLARLGISGVTDRRQYQWILARAPVELIPVTDCGPRLQFRSPASPPPHLPADQRSPSYLRLQALHCQALPSGRERRNLLAIGKCKFSTLPLFSWKLSHLSKPPPCHVEPLPAAHPIVLFPRVFSEMRVGPCVSPLGGRRGAVSHCFFAVCYFGEREQHKATTALDGVERMDAGRCEVFFLIFIYEQLLDTWALRDGFCRNMRVI